MDNNNTCDTYYQKITTTATKNKNKEGVLEEARNRGKEKGGKEKAK